MKPKILSGTEGNSQAASNWEADNHQAEGVDTGPSEGKTSVANTNTVQRMTWFGEWYDKHPHWSTIQSQGDQYWRMIPENNEELLGIL